MSSCMRPVRTGPEVPFLSGAHSELPKPGCVIPKPYPLLPSPHCSAEPPKRRCLCTVTCDIST